MLADDGSAVPVSEHAAALLAAVEDGAGDVEQVFVRAGAHDPMAGEPALRAAWASLLDRRLVVDLDRHLERLAELRAHGGSRRAELTELLTGADAEQRWAARRGARVTVLGDGPTAQAVTAALVDSGVGCGTVPAGRSADLAVLAFDHEPHAELLESLMREDVPHLVGGTRDTGARIGPLVVPGATPCCRCLDLHRSAADPTWRWRRVALSRPSRHPLATVPASGPVREVTAALVTAETLGFVEGAQPRTLSSTVTLTGDDLVPVVTESAAHPWCGCVWPDSTYG
jgi:hypothetical protein